MTLFCDDVLHWAETYTGPQFHAMLTDAPYSLGDGTRGFMAKTWDTDIALRPETWKALAQHLLPGAFGICFGSARGWHRLACALEDAGLILHPSVFVLGWAQGSGWPKATRIDTAVDKAAGAAQEVTGYADTRSRYDHYDRKVQDKFPGVYGVCPSTKHPLTTPATPLAQTWEGHRYGRQCLKPALEPAIVFQVPYQGRPIESITATGAGAMWIDGARLPVTSADTQHTARPASAGKDYGEKLSGVSYGRGLHSRCEGNDISLGRWPPNLALVHLPTCQPRGAQHIPGDPRGACDGKRPAGFGNVGAANGSGEPNARVYGDETVVTYACAPGCPVASLDAQAGERSSNSGTPFQRQPDDRRTTYGHFEGTPAAGFYGDSGPASRFFFTADWSLDVAEQLANADPVRYTPKASRAERDEGLAQRPLQDIGEYPGRNLVHNGKHRIEHGQRTGPRAHSNQTRNNHPTIKPIALCTWLARLLLPPAAYAPRRLLVPFCGTSSEMIGATFAGWDEIVGIEQDPDTVAIATQRLAYWTTQIAAQLSLWP